MSFNGFTLLPADDPQTAPQDDLAAAVDGALAVTAQAQPVTPPAPRPFGNSWRFDWQAGQFVRIGSSPAPVSELDTLAEWIQMAIHSARYSTPIFSDAFGMQEPEDLIGTLVEGEALADWRSALVEAILVHDRVSDVENIVLDWNPQTGILTIVTMNIITDLDEDVTVSNLSLTASA